MTDKNTLSEISNDKCKLEMTPMIDVTFLLLIFFMCTLRFKVLEAKLEAHLPKDAGVAAPLVTPPLEKVDIRIEVANPGSKLRWDAASRSAVAYTQADAVTGRRFYYGDDRRLRYTVAGRQARDLAEVSRRLRALRDADPKIKATIDPRDGSVQKDVVDVLDAALGAGFNDITFQAAARE